MSDQNQQAYDEAMKELDQIQKSDDQTTEDELDALTKALEEEIATGDLAKSDKEGDDGDDGDDGKGGDDDDDDKPFGKSEDDFDDELIKASEAYADLTKSVEIGIGGLFSELDAMKKSMAALMNLNIKQAKVIAEMVKSRKDETDAITKSLSTLGAAPTVPNKATFGVSGGQEVPMTKSVSEIQDALLKAVQEGTVAAQNLAAFATYKDINRLSSEVRQVIGC